MCALFIKSRIFFTEVRAREAHAWRCAAREKRKLARDPAAPRAPPRPAAPPRAWRAPVSRLNLSSLSQCMFYRWNVSFINRGRRATTLSGLSVPFKCAAHMPGKAVRFMAVKRALRPELMKFSRAMVCWSTRVMSHAHSSLSHPTQPAAQSCDVHRRAAGLIHHLAQHLSTVWDVRGDVPNESAPAATGSSHASLPTTHPPDPT